MNKRKQILITCVDLNVQNDNHEFFGVEFKLSVWKILSLLFMNRGHSKTSLEEVDEYPEKKTHSKGCD